VPILLANKFILCVHLRQADVNQKHAH